MKSGDGKCWEWVVLVMGGGCGGDWWCLRVWVAVVVTLMVVLVVVCD